MSLTKEQKVKMISDVTDYLRNTYCLDDEDNLNAEQVADLCEMIVEHFLSTCITEHYEELESVLDSKIKEFKEAEILHRKKKHGHATAEHYKSGVIFAEYFKKFIKENK